MKLILLFYIVLASAFTHRIHDGLPPTNAKVLEYVNTVIGKKVDRGECWDLANKALTFANAQWTFPTTFGKPIDYKTEIVLAGDIIQINNVVMESKTATSITRWKMTEHTAIVYEVLDGTTLKVAEQNVNKVRKVQINEWNLADIKSGKMQFYRPQPKP
jgi:hypothetical protein